jgi:hypothetical protein
MFWPVLLLGSDALVGDTLAVRRAREQLARRAQEVPSLQLYADLADAVYLTLRGEHDRAIARFEQVLPELAIKQRVAWHTARSVFAEALNGAGQHERAKAVLQEVLAALGPADTAVVGRYLEPRRQLALTEAALGNHALAASMLDGLLAEHGAQDQPLLIGLLHKARAEVALATADASVFERHAAEMETRFRATQNPCLIAQWERLLERAVRAGVRARNDAIVRSQRPEAPSRSSLRILSELEAAPDPALHAVRLLVARTRASAAHLYELRGGQLRLLESSRGTEPAREVEAELFLRYERSQAELREEQSAEDRPTVIELAPDVEPDSVFLDSEPPVGSRAKLQTILLQHSQSSVTSTVGGLILEFPADVTPSVDPGLLDAIASVLHERRMLTTQS